MDINYNFIIFTSEASVGASVAVNFIFIVVLVLY